MASIPNFQSRKHSDFSLSDLDQPIKKQQKVQHSQARVEPADEKASSVFKTQTPHFESSSISGSRKRKKSDDDDSSPVTVSFERLNFRDSSTSSSSTSFERIAAQNSPYFSAFSARASSHVNFGDYREPSNPLTHGATDLPLVDSDSDEEDPELVAINSSTDSSSSNAISFTSLNSRLEMIRESEEEIPFDVLTLNEPLPPLRDPEVQAMAYRPAHSGYPGQSDVDSEFGLALMTPLPDDDF